MIKNAIFVSFFLSSPLLAQNFLYCNQTNSYIYLGASLEQVKQNCGEPISTQTLSTPSIKSQEVLQWIYDFQPNSGVIQGEFQSKSQSLIINFVDNKVFQILMEGKSVNQSYFCRPDRAIQIGDPPDRVYQICQWPNIKQTNTINVPQSPVQQLILTYSQGEYMAPKKLYFQNNILISME